MGISILYDLYAHNSLKQGPVQVSAAAAVNAAGRRSQISVVLNILAAAADSWIQLSWIRTTWIRRIEFKEFANTSSNIFESKNNILTDE